MSRLPYPWKQDEQISTVDDADIVYGKWLGDNETELESYLKWLFGHMAEVVKRADSDLRHAASCAGREPA